MVVLEAMAAGLGIVTTVNGSANLDVSKPFITVIPDEKLLDAEYVVSAIRRNREVALTMREEIRAYAEQTFSWSKAIVPKYRQLVGRLLKVQHERRQEELKTGLPLLPWTSKYARLQACSMKQLSKTPYLAVVTFLEHFTSKITQWIDCLHLLGVDMFLFYTLHEHGERLLPLLREG